MGGGPVQFDLANGEDSLGSLGERLEALSAGWDSVDCWYRADGQAAVDALESGPPLHSESSLLVAVGASSRDAPDAREHELADCEVAVAGVQSASGRAAGVCRGFRAAAAESRPCTARPRIAVSTWCGGCSSMLRRRPPSADVALVVGLRYDLAQGVRLSVPACELCTAPATPCFVATASCTRAAATATRCGS